MSQGWCQGCSQCTLEAPCIKCAKVGCVSCNKCFQCCNCVSSIFVQCPHCLGCVEVVEVNCAIFRHAYTSLAPGTLNPSGNTNDTAGQCPPHASLQQCTPAPLGLGTAGCGLPFRIVTLPTNHTKEYYESTHVAIACGYI